MTSLSLREECLQQAAWHGGYTKAIVRLVVVEREFGFTVRPVLEDQAYKFARSAARWASSYLDHVEAGA